MDETRKTIVFGAVAVVLVLLAVVTAPKKITPDAFLDQGEAFFPDFEDPNAARALEVIDFDEETGSARPFKVTFKEGKWTIPSHHDYPADGEERLAATAAGVIGIAKDDFRSDNVSDHEACGVLDPLDDKVVGMEGRGQRITIRGENDVVLADFIIGKTVEERENFRFVRVPGQKRVYAVRMNIDISTKFGDWIETDLLKVDKGKIDRVMLKDYSINERTGRVDERDVLILNRADDVWSANRMQSGEEVATTKINELLTSIDELKIVGVRPKPAGLTATLTRSLDSLQVGQADMLSLQSKGYFFSRDGQLLSNEGELTAATDEGVVYTLRFGEVTYGTGLAITAGTGTPEDGADEESGENRYLFITTSFDGALFPEPARPANANFENRPDSLWSDSDRRNKELTDAHKEWREKVEKGRSVSSQLNARFAKWYYVISAKSFDELRVKRSDMVVKKES